MSIADDAGRILHALAEFKESPEDEHGGRHNLTGEGVRHALLALQSFEMEPVRVNDAVVLLEENGYVRLDLWAGTAPYRFGGIELTPRGRLEYEKLESRRSAASSVTKQNRTVPSGNKLFIGHGRAPAWRVLKDFIQDRLRLEWEEFNREPTAGLSTKERLQTMLNNSQFAFLVMTGEDELSTGAKSARANVIHEVGLFQGRLGFERAIVLLEDGCEEFSNIEGITQIRFPKDNIGATFEEVRRVLEREKILGNG